MKTIGSILIVLGILGMIGSGVGRMGKMNDPNVLGEWIGSCLATTVLFFIPGGILIYLAARKAEKKDGREAPQSRDTTNQNDRDAISKNLTPD